MACKLNLRFRFQNSDLNTDSTACRIVELECSWSIVCALNHRTLRNVKETHNSRVKRNRFQSLIGGRQNLRESGIHKNVLNIIRWTRTHHFVKQTTRFQFKFYGRLFICNLHPPESRVTIDTRVFTHITLSPCIMLYGYPRFDFTHTYTYI